MANPRDTARVGFLDDLVVTDSDLPVRPAGARRRPPSPRRCASCDVVWQPSDRRPRPYCGLACESLAKAVRYARKAIALHPDGLPPDVAWAVRIKRAHTLAGGYRASARRIPRPVYERVWTRDHGLCRMCGAPGDEVDHIDGDSPDPSNLRVLCTACHRTVTAAHLQPLPDDPALKARAHELQRRTLAQTAKRPCDEPGWDWNAWCTGSGLVGLDGAV